MTERDYIISRIVLALRRSGEYEEGNIGLAVADYLEGQSELGERADKYDWNRLVRSVERELLRS